MEELDWPAQSSDLNPIRHAGMNWDGDCEPGILIKSVPDLSNALLYEWAKKSHTTNPKSNESHPRRVEAVKAAKMGPTPYVFRIQCP